jgi:hypothetical protein
MKPIVIIVTVFVLLIPMSSTYGSSNWWSDVKFYDDIFVDEEYEYPENIGFPDWVENPFIWYGDDKISDYEILNIIKFLIHNEIILIDKLPTPECSGDARCIPGIITKIIDGDTVKVYGKSVRFALSSTPELDESGGMKSKEFIENICPVGSTVLVDEDDGQTQGSYGRIIGVIYCNGLNLNEEVLTNGSGYLSSGFCSTSEFSSHKWAQKFGC